jgi:hypothetical protein
MFRSSKGQVPAFATANSLQEGNADRQQCRRTDTAEYRPVREDMCFNLLAGGSLKDRARTSLLRLLLSLVFKSFWPEVCWELIQNLRVAQTGWVLSLGTSSKACVFF